MNSCYLFLRPDVFHVMRALPAPASLLTVFPQKSGGQSEPVSLCVPDALCVSGVLLPVLPLLQGALSAPVSPSVPGAQPVSVPDALQVSSLLQDVPPGQDAPDVPVSLLPGVLHAPGVFPPERYALPAGPGVPGAVPDGCPGSCCCSWNSAGGLQTPDFSSSALQTLPALPFFRQPFPLRRKSSFLLLKRPHCGSPQLYYLRSCSYDS